METALVIATIVSASIALIALGISCWVAWTNHTQRRIAEKDLTLTAYANAIQSILKLKQNFSDHPEIFEEQVKINPTMRNYIPAYMDTSTFLTFAGSMWQFSYVFSVWSRGEDLGLKEEERIGLKKEMLLWLENVPGFYDVYRSHVSILKVHNPEFLKFLDEVYKNRNIQTIDNIHEHNAVQQQLQH